MPTTGANAPNVLGGHKRSRGHRSFPPRRARPRTRSIEALHGVSGREVCLQWRRSFAEIAGMSQADNGTSADEATPGRYVAKEVPLSKAGDWKLSVRISPKGQAIQIVPIALAVS